MPDRVAFGSRPERRRIENLVDGEVENRALRPYCRGRWQDAFANALPSAQRRYVERKIRRSADGNQAGATEHSGFFPQHRSQGTAQHYDLSGQRRQADGTDPVLRQVFSRARNQQPGTADLQARDLNGGHRPGRAPAWGSETGGGGSDRGDANPQFRYSGLSESACGGLTCKKISRD